MTKRGYKVLSVALTLALAVGTLAFGKVKAEAAEVTNDINVENQGNEVNNGISLTVKYFFSIEEVNGLCSDWRVIDTQTASSEAFENGNSFSAEFDKKGYSVEQHCDFKVTGDVYVYGAGVNKGNLCHVDQDTIDADDSIATTVSDDSDRFKIEFDENYWSFIFGENKNVVLYVKCKSYSDVDITYVLKSGNDVYLANEPEAVSAWPTADALIGQEGVTEGFVAEEALASANARIFGDVKLNGSTSTDWTEITDENRMGEFDSLYAWNCETKTWEKLVPVISSTGNMVAISAVEARPVLYVYGTPIMPKKESESTYQPVIVVVNPDPIVDNEEKEEVQEPAPTPEVEEIEEEEIPAEIEAIEIVEEETPEGDVSLPQTGTLAVGVFYGLGAACVALGGAITTKARRKED